MCHYTNIRLNEGEDLQKGRVYHKDALCLRQNARNDGVLYVRIMRCAQNAPRSVDAVRGAGFLQRYPEFKWILVSAIAFNPSSKYILIRLHT